MVISAILDKLISHRRIGMRRNTGIFVRISCPLLLHSLPMLRWEYKATSEAVRDAFLDLGSRRVHVLPVSEMLLQQRTWCSSPGKIVCQRQRLQQMCFGQQTCINLLHRCLVTILSARLNSAVFSSRPHSQDVLRMQRFSCIWKEITRWERAG